MVVAKQRCLRRRQDALHSSYRSEYPHRELLSRVSPESGSLPCMPSTVHYSSLAGDLYGLTFSLQSEHINSLHDYEFLCVHFLNFSWASQALVLKRATEDKHRDTTCWTPPFSSPEGNTSGPHSHCLPTPWMGTMDTHPSKTEDGFYLIFVSKCLEE